MSAANWVLAERLPASAVIEAVRAAGGKASVEQLMAALKLNRGTVLLKCTSLVMLGKLAGCMCGCGGFSLPLVSVE